MPVVPERKMRAEICIAGGMQVRDGDRGEYDCLVEQVTVVTRWTVRALGPRLSRPPCDGPPPILIDVGVVHGGGLNEGVISELYRHRQTVPLP